ncbi:MAG TPA: hypothetical protein VF141_00265, partial [Chryseolinea sp.]
YGGDSKTNASRALALKQCHLWTSPTPNHCQIFDLVLQLCELLQKRSFVITSSQKSHQGD